MVHAADYFIDAKHPHTIYIVDRRSRLYSTIVLEQGSPHAFGRTMRSTTPSPSGPPVRPMRTVPSRARAMIRYGAAGCVVMIRRSADGWCVARTLPMKGATGGHKKAGHEGA